MSMAYVLRSRIINNLNIVGLINLRTTVYKPPNRKNVYMIKVMY